MKIVALNGLLGYGYTEIGLQKAFEAVPDYLGVDAGSIDPGPYYLGSGKAFTNREAVKRDVELALPLAIENRVPFIIGTAGGSGSEVHLHILKSIIEEIATEKGLNFKMAVIYTDVTPEYIKAKLRAGKIRPMGSQLNLTEEEIDKSVRIVSQIGVEPFIEALEHDVDVVLAGRACDTAIYAAPAIKAGYHPGEVLHMAKIMECGGMCSVPMSASDVMIGRIESGYFELEPANPERRCTIEKVAAHTMYEQANPYFIFEPDGMIDLRESKYYQVNERVVRVENSKFVPNEIKTLKIEGVKSVGFRTICIGCIKDPQTSMRLDSIFEDVKDFVKNNIGSRIQEDYSINLRKYGMPLVSKEETTIPENDLGFIIDVVAQTQDNANTICALLRARLLHYDYPGRKTTAGNIAFPYSPSDIPVGQVFSFNIYHLVEVDDLSETSKIEYIMVGG